MNYWIYWIIFIIFFFVIIRVKMSTANISKNTVYCDCYYKTTTIEYYIEFKFYCYIVRFRGLVAVAEFDTQYTFHWIKSKIRQQLYSVCGFIYTECVIPLNSWFLISILYRYGKSIKTFWKPERLLLFSQKYSTTDSSPALSLIITRNRFIIVCVKTNSDFSLLLSGWLYTT